MVLGIYSNSLLTILISSMKQKAGNQPKEGRMKCLTSKERITCKTLFGGRSACFSYKKSVNKLGSSSHDLSQSFPLLLYRVLYKK